MRDQSSKGLRCVAGGLVALMAALIQPEAASGQVTIHELARQRLEQIRERVQDLTPEEIAQLRLARQHQQKSAAVGLKQIGDFTCLPTCDPDDAKFLAIAGTGLVTLSDPVLDLSVSAPPDTTSFQLGIFDGDGGLPDPTSIDNVGGGNFSRWDLTGLFGFTPQDVDYSYRLFASPPGGPETQIDLTPSTPDPCPTNCEFQGADMLNDDWLDFTVSTGPEAATPSGNFLYRLEIAQDTSDPDLFLHVNLFKVRTTGVVTLRLTNQPFSYISVVNVSEDFFDVFPLDGGFFNAEPTSYDGEWSFFFDVASNQSELIVWDGDFDRGDSADFGFTNQDTDDPDTPGDPFMPGLSGLFDSTADACFEDVAQNNPMETCGTGGSPSGSPADNLTIPPPFDPTNATFLSLDQLAVRDPTVRAEVIFPDGRVFNNENPSGNQEWEQFVVSQTASCDPSPSCVPVDGNPMGLNPEDPVGAPCADVCLPPQPGQIPEGVYEIRVQGVDMFNLNAIRLPQILCVDDAGAPCQPLRDYLLGDTIFLDLDGNGVQDLGESGIPGVLVELLAENGGIAGTSVTDSNGNYAFAVDGGTFTVQVAARNFSTPTVGGAVGDLVWLDEDASGDDNGGLEPGLANVKVVLYEEMAGENVFVASTVTDSDGRYAFTDLPPGTYFTDVADVTVPAGLALVSGPDPSASVTIVTNEVFDTLDFGYQFSAPTDTAIVGDLVWLDEDGDGFFDAGERGIGGVTLALIASDLSLDVFGNPLVIAKTQTRDDGFYLFTDVPTNLGTDYQVQVTDDFGLLTGLALTSGVGTQSQPNPTAEFPVVDGDVILTQDFGYTTSALFSISDRVWLDDDRDGDDDLGAEVGLDGVTVMLTGPTGAVMDVTTTSGGGQFSFDGLPDGAYSLVISDLGGVLDGLLPTTGASISRSQEVTLAGADVAAVSFGWVDTGALEGLVGTTLKDSVSNVDQQTDVVPDGDPTPPIGDGPNNLDYDFGYIAAGSLGDRVWLDLDGDGTDNGGTEPGIEGVTVTLDNAASGLMETTTTDNSGFYLFDGLRPTNSGLTGDAYVVTVDDSTLPAGVTVRTFDLDGTGTPDTATASLGTSAPGIVDNRIDVDFGYRGTGSIGDRVWEDVNGDGDQTGENGINGVTVELLDSTGTVIATDVTSGDGNYLFDGLPPDDYTVRVVPPAGFDPTFDLDLTLDNETTVALGLGENRDDVDFGYQQPILNGSIGDRVWNDVDGDGVQDAGEAGVNDVTVRLFDVGGALVAMDVTSGDGEYRFLDLGPGTYTVEVDASTLPVDFVQTFDIEGPLDDQATVDLGAGENRDDVDFGYADKCLADIDFETDGNGNGLVTGQIIDDEWAAFGVMVSTGDPAHPAMIFDTSNPTGADYDLGTPNETFGGPGIGSGGEAGQLGQNAVPLGKVLIISEDGDSRDPDDNAGGGTLTFNFAYPVRVDQIGILDIDEGLGGTVKAFDGSGTLIGAAAMADRLGNNSVQTVSLGAQGVRRLEVHFPGSGAITDLAFCVDCTPIRVRDDFNIASFANNDGPNNWVGDWIENDPESGGAGAFMGQVQIRGGFLRLDDQPNTGGHPSLAREADLSGAATATLRFDFDTTHGVDPSDAVTVEISADGGVSWTTLEVITDIYGSTWQDRTFDITPFISAETQVRFRVSNLYGGHDEFFYVNFVEIETRCGGSLTVRDEFNEQLFSNNDGPDDWQGAWIEDDPAAGGAGPTAGHVKVFNQALKLFDYPNTGGEPSAARQVDLSGRSVATLSFDWWTSSGVDSDDAITVEASADGGASWMHLLTLTGIYGADSGSESLDLSGLISSDTQIRFRVSNKYGGSSEFFFADNIQVQAD